MTTPAALVAEQLRDDAAGWSVGTWGAVADLERDPGEPTTHDGLAAWTDRGGVRADDLSGVRLVAYERCLRAPGSWRQAVALCLPPQEARLAARTSVTELGPDAAALRAADRDAVLFDLGLGTPFADFCVRTGDADLIGHLRVAEGRSIWDAELGIAGRVLSASPDRVVITRVMRAEVRTPIPPPGGITPWGPHTHLLPKLLRTGRSHPAIEPIPDGLVPLASVFPAHPVIGPRGTTIPFDAHRHERFDDLLAAHGAADHLTIKADVIDAVLAGRAPAPLRREPGSIARARATRVTLRQLAHLAPDAPGLPAWRALFGEPDPALPTSAPT